MYRSLKHTKIENNVTVMLFDIFPAVVTLLLRNPKTGASFVKTATIMRKGMSFGVSYIQLE